MELPQRKGEDRFLPAGWYRRAQSTLRDTPALTEVRSLVISAFDRRTRMLPFIDIDWYTVPCGPRSIAAALCDAGMVRTRFSFQLWNPNLRPSRAEIESRPIDMLLVSAMQVHSDPSYKLIEDAWTLGDRRPLILAGGPKACFQPVDYFGLGSRGEVGADVVVTGEEPVLLELLMVLSQFGGGAGTMRAAFERARKAGALHAVPGLVFSADGRHDGKNLVNTGIQRLLCDLDELPMPSLGFKVLEPPHRGVSLGASPIPKAKLNHQLVISMLITRGCKFNCHYCPIPSYNQRTHRRKSPDRIVAEFKDCLTHTNSHYFFGADDNFLNNHRYAREVLEKMAATRINGKPLGRSVRFATEATVIDAYKCRDLFELAGHNKSGFEAIWMGVEDLSGTLVDKGQGPSIVEELFADMTAHKMYPMVMMMHHDDQPLESPGKMTGLLNQIRFLQKAGAMSMQCTLANPQFGTRWMNEVIMQGRLYESVGGVKIADRDFDGNHVIASIHANPLRMQLNYLRAYATFYNPWSLLQSLRVRKASVRNKHLFYQTWGMAGLVRTAWRLKGYIWRLGWGKITRLNQWPEKLRRPGSPYPQLIESTSPVAKEANVPVPSLSEPLSKVTEKVDTLV